MNAIQYELQNVSAWSNWEILETNRFHLIGLLVHNQQKILLYNAWICDFHLSTNETLDAFSMFSTLALCHCVSCATNSITLSLQDGSKMDQQQMSTIAEVSMLPSDGSEQRSLSHVSQMAGQADIRCQRLSAHTDKVLSSLLQDTSRTQVQTVYKIQCQSTTWRSHLHDSRMVLSAST